MVGMGNRKGGENGELGKEDSPKRARGERVAREDLVSRPAWGGTVTPVERQAVSRTICTRPQHPPFATSWPRARALKMLFRIDREMDPGNSRGGFEDLALVSWSEAARGLWRGGMEWSKRYWGVQTFS